MLTRILSIIALQGIAVLTAMLHQHVGLHTDEAKYLLNIPYPHPPLLRWLMGLTDGWQHQELFWRILFASFLMHGVWLVADMARKLPREQQITVCGLWLFSGALLLQSGTLMMSCITAVQALFLLWMLSRPEFLQKWSVLIAALWLEMLFTAYQGVLFAPLVWVALERSHLPFLKRLSAFLIPIILLALYTLGNPLAVAAMGFVGEMGRGVPPEEFISRSLRLWFIAGSGVLSILGIYGILKRRDVALMLTLLLVTLYSVISYREYYAVLFTPLFIAGALATPRLKRSPAFILALQMVSGIALFFYIPFSITSNARAVSRQFERLGVWGTVLIEGSFGHEWQYFMPGPVRRFQPDFVPDATAFVCESPCREEYLRVVRSAGFTPYPGFGYEVWVKTGSGSG